MRLEGEVNSVEKVGDGKGRPAMGIAEHDAIARRALRVRS